MDNKKKGAIAAVAGFLLLTIAGTFALWTQTEELETGEISSAKFGIKAAKMDFYDVSNDRSDISPIAGWAGDSETKEGHAIDPETWRIVPKDTVLGLGDINGQLSGENLVAELTVKTNTNKDLTVINSDGDGYSSAIDDGYTVAYALANVKGELLNPKTGEVDPANAWVNSPSKIKFTSDKNAESNLLKMDDTLSGSPEYKLAVKVTFNAKAQDLTKTKEELQGMKVGLEQTANSTLNEF